MAFDALRSTFRRDPVGGSDAAAMAAPAPVVFDTSAPAASALDAAAGPAHGAVFADPTVAGGTDASAFACPSCGRTIARGAWRCAGCHAWLLFDLPLRRAATLIGGGAIAGVLVTLLLVNLFAPAARPVAAAGDPAGGTGTTPGGVSSVAVPAGAAAALRGTTALNGRLAAESAALSGALAASSFKSGDVVKILRRMSLDVRAGAGMAPALGGWPDAAGQQAALQAFYDDLGAKIDGGLAASVTNQAAYKRAAKSVLATLRAVRGLDADARALAGQASLELDPVAIPAALR